MFYSMLHLQQHFGNGSSTLAQISPFSKLDNLPISSHNLPEVKERLHRLLLFLGSTVLSSPSPFYRHSYGSSYSFFPSSPIPHHHSGGWVGVTFVGHEDRWRHKGRTNRHPQSAAGFRCCAAE